jgi:hypothetical protein
MEETYQAGNRFIRRNYCMDDTTHTIADRIHAIWMCTHSLSQAEWRVLYGKNNSRILRKLFPPRIRHLTHPKPCGILGYRTAGIENIPDREFSGMETDSLNEE